MIEEFRTILNLNKRRVDMTAQRTLILKIINDTCEHLNAEQVYMAAKAEMPGIAMATVYKNIFPIMSI